ncbi:hypothetical protein OG604_17440 [Streptomyces sp. NBC_01231]|nr:hypothetical protein OG604_17440 [Streptomyces sp. NBC_01231]
MQGRVAEDGGHLLGVFDPQREEVEAGCGEGLGRHEGLGHRLTLFEIREESGRPLGMRVPGTTSAGDLVSKATG